MSALGPVKRWLERYGRAVALALVVLAIISGGIAFLSRAPLGGQSVEVVFPTPTPPQEFTPSPSQAKLNINIASAQELEALRGIGPALAGRIVQYREEHGPFQRIEDIVDVPGIGPAIFQKIKGFITVSPVGLAESLPTPTPSLSTPTPTATSVPGVTPTPLPVATIPTLTPTPLSPTSSGCHPSYPDVCIPPPPPDLDCKDISVRNFRVLPPDPQGFDGDNDGIGCET